MSEEEQGGADFRRDLEELLGSQLVDRLDSDVFRSLSEHWEELGFGAGLRADPDRESQARKILAGLVPLNIDVKLWADLAAGRNVDLPVTDNYGSAATRLAPSGRLAKLSAGSKGNDFGRVHSKGSQEPSAWLTRQGRSAAAKLKRIAELKADLADAEEEYANLQHGLKTYAATLLLTALRKAVAPVFAMGPAWTLLEAIAGPSSDEIVGEDRERQTKLIMIILHALRDDIAFRRELKSAILSVCQRYQGAARNRGADVWDLPYDPNDILDHLGFSDPDADRRKADQERQRRE